MHPLLSVVCFRVNNFQEILRHPKLCSEPTSHWNSGSASTTLWSPCCLMIFKAFRIGQRKSGSLWVSQSRVFFCFREMLHSNGFQLVQTSMEKLLPRLLMVGELLGQFIRWTLDSAEQNALIYMIFKWCKWCEERVKSKAGLYIAALAYALYLPPSHVWPLVSSMNCDFQQVGIWFQMEVPCNWPCQHLRAKATQLKQNILSPRNEPSTNLKIAKQNQSLLPSGRSICISALLKVFSLYLLPQGGAAEPFLPLPTLYRIQS